MCLAHGPQHYWEVSEARTRGPSVSSQALYQGTEPLRPKYEEDARQQISTIKMQGSDTGEHILHWLRKWVGLVIFILTLE